LGFVDWHDSLDGLQFDDDFTVHDHVDFVSTIELQAFVRNRKIDLAFERQSTEVQFMAQALFVGGFE
jgi:hypothetical protein